MGKRLLMSIPQVNNLNCSKTEIPPIKRDFLFGNMCFCDSNIFCNWLCIRLFCWFSCFQYIKGTKKKANHNNFFPAFISITVVSNTSKALKRKQITTYLYPHSRLECCFQYIKGTKKKANHNIMAASVQALDVVSNTSKVLKRKQITTSISTANFNRELFPIHQRY